MKKPIVRYLERHYPQIIREAETICYSTLRPVPQDLQRLHNCISAETKHERRLLYMAAFLFIYDPKVIKERGNLLNPGLRAMVAHELDIDLRSVDSVSRYIKTSVWQYERLRNFRDRVNLIIDTFYK